MGCTIKAKFLMINPDNAEVTNTLNYLHKRDMYKRLNKDNLGDEIIHIELKSTPEIFKTLRNIGYFEDLYNLNQNIYDFSLFEITELGVKLYLFSMAGDGFIFIPHDNIACFYSFHKTFLEETRDYLRK